MKEENGVKNRREKEESTESLVFGRNEVLSLFRTGKTDRLREE